jgi:hypothetical protein
VGKDFNQFILLEIFGSSLVGFHRASLYVIQCSTCIKLVKHNL